MSLGGALTFWLALNLVSISLAGAEPSMNPKGVDQGKRELGGIKKKIQEEKQRVKDISKKESSVISQLNSLDRNLSERDKDLKALKGKLTAVDRKVQKANQDLKLLTQTIDSLESLLLNRLVVLYKFGGPEMPQVLFSSRSYGDFMSTRHYLASLLEQDHQLIEDYRKRKTAIGDYRSQLRDDGQELQSLKKKTEQKRAEIQKDLTQKGVLLDSVRQEKQIHVAAIRELEAASAQLQSLINRLEKELQERAKGKNFFSPGKGFGTLRGKLPRPVSGRILTTFGKNENPKFNTFTVQKGIEIEAPLGAGIRAVYEGRVLYSNWFKGYGKILIIDHGEGYYTLSGHASSLLKEVGEEVRAGEVVALVGETGSLKGPCLYFEIRQRGKPLDPLEWLSH